MTTHRSPVSRQDFGVSFDFGRNLRKLQRSCNPNTTCRDYGIFLYKDAITGEFLVGIKDFLTWKIIDVEKFPTLEDLKNVWELD